MMSKAIKVTYLFTGRTTAYESVDAFRKDAKEHYDVSVAGLIDTMSDAYANGRTTNTYEWMLGVKIEDTYDKAA